MQALEERTETGKDRLMTKRTTQLLHLGRSILVIVALSLAIGFTMSRCQKAAGVFLSDSSPLKKTPARPKQTPARPHVLPKKPAAAHRGSF